MTVVDVHAHALFPEVMGLAGAAGPEMGERDGVPFFRSGEYVLSNVRFADSPFSDIGQRLALMDRMGIDHQIMSPNPLTYFHAQPADVAERFCRAQNDAMSRAVRAHPQRLSGLAQLPMQSPGAAVAELQRAVGELGLVGGYIGSDIGGRPLNDRSFDEVWAAFEALDVPVVVHPGTVGAELRAGEPQALREFDLDIVVGFANDETFAVTQLLYGGVLDRHPGLRVQIPHAGGTSPYLKGRIRTALERRPWARGLLSRPFDALWQQLSFDCLVGTQEAMRFIIESEGPQRVMLGSNFSGWDQESEIVDRVRRLGLPEQATRDVLGRSAIRYFRLPIDSD